MHQKTNLLFVLLILVGVSAPLSAKAALGGSTEEITVEVPINAFPRSGFNVIFFNDPRVSESKFTMRLSSPGVVTGCATMTDSEHTLELKNKKAKLEVVNPELELFDETRYSQYSCDVKENVSYIDVPLDRDQLIRKKIENLKLKTKEYDGDDIIIREFVESDIRVTKEKIELSATSGGLSYNVNFWFYPKNTVVLHAPQASQSADVQSLIRDFGVSLGLKELENKMSGFTLPYNADNYVFFTEPTGSLIKEIGSVGKHIKVGTINPTKAIYGPNGLEQRPYSLNVMATLPGQPTQ